VNLKGECSGENNRKRRKASDINELLADHTLKQLMVTLSEFFAPVAVVFAGSNSLEASTENCARIECLPIGWCCDSRVRSHRKKARG
jgi:hypothetical protein